jgi:ADP-heptose:LPS heptosyltransferase/predicted SAM-dependent methyltransferase
MWTLETSQGFESDKIAALVVPYTRGQGLDIGCGMRTVWPHAIGVDNGHHFGSRTAAKVFSEGGSLPLFADGSLDFIFSSHLLEHFHRENVPAILKEWARVLKVGGYLVLYVPSANLYPKCGEPGANPDHKWDIYPGDIESVLKNSSGFGWTQVENEERGTDQDNEYSLFEVYQKRADGEFVQHAFQRNPEGKKRALVIRYGAIGDQIMAASILPELRKQGYHITYQTTPKAQEILRHDPHIDEWWIQDTDQVPNEQLGPYWLQLELSGRWDKIVNLCESIEGQCLALPGRFTSFYSHETRRRILNRNYLEFTHDIANVPYKFHARFYPTDQEKLQAQAVRADISAPIIVWSLNGSSVHKVYPFTQIVAAWLMQNTPCHLFLVADAQDGKMLQDAILEELQEKEIDTSRIHPMAGVWGIRQALTFACTQADVVVGPETGVLNAAGLEKVEKVIYLSHSSKENLTKHWVNTTTLEPIRDRTPCYPCHMLHSDYGTCHKVEETGAALCASNVPPETIFKAIARALGANVTVDGKKVA